MIYKEEVNEINFARERPEWEKEHGRINSRILERVCENCDTACKEDDVIMYVACQDGKVVWWHRNKCKE